MRILITNDDGMHADQLLPLIRWCQKLGDVTVVVPKVEQSGKSQGIELHKPFEVVQVDLLPGVTAYTVDSTPADCIRYAVLGMKLHFDLVISGINKGYNLGHDIAYSGTVGAIMEAARLGVPAIAFSMNYESKAEDVIDQLDDVLAFMNENGLWECGSLYNVNLHNTPEGICITRQGGMFYSDAFEKREGDYYIQVGDPIRNETLDLTVDTDAIWAGYTTVTPLTHDRTDKEVLDKLMGR